MSSAGWDLVYCSLIGLCSWALLREWFSKGFLTRTPLANVATMAGLIVFVVGGLAHRLYGFNPDFHSWKNWGAAIIAPFFLAILTTRRDKSAQANGRPYLRLYKEAVEAGVIGDWTRAKEKFEEALEDNRDDRPSRECLQICLDVIERRIDVVTGMHVFRSVELGDAGNSAAAIEHLELACTQSPRYARIHIDLGSLYARNSRFSDARRELAAGIALDPMFARAHYLLGCVCEDEGDNVEATRHHQDALQIDPNFTLARDHLDALRR